MIIPEIHLIFDLIFDLILFNFTFNFHIGTTPVSTSDQRPRRAPPGGVREGDAQAGDVVPRAPEDRASDEVTGVVPM